MAPCQQPPAVAGARQPLQGVIHGRAPGRASSNIAPDRAGQPLVVTDILGPDSATTCRMLMAVAGAGRQAAVESCSRGGSMARRRQSRALPMLDDGESSKTQFGVKRPGVLE
jgi:hypothetical protein